jgi:hypothetical protein
MPIKREISKADYDALGDALKALYRANGDKFTLDAEGFDDVTGLKSALDAERRGRGDLETQLRELRTKLGDLDPEKARAAIKLLQDLEDKSDLADIPEAVRAKIDKIVEKRTERMRLDHDTQVNAFKKQVGDGTSEREKLVAQLSELLIDNSIRSAAGKLGIRDEAVEDAVLAGKQLYRIKDGKPVPMNGEQVVYGKDASTPMPIDEWLGGKQKERPHWFKDSTGSGAKSNLGGGGGGNAHSITETQAKDRAAYTTAKAAADKAGVELQIVAG